MFAIHTNMISLIDTIFKFFRDQLIRQRILTTSYATWGFIRLSNNHKDCSLIMQFYLQWRLYRPYLNQSLFISRRRSRK